MRWLVLIVGVVAILVGFVLGALIATYRVPNIYIAFAQKTQDLGTVCAGTTIRQNDNAMTVAGPAIVLLTSTIYGASTGIAYDPQAESYQLAVPGYPSPFVMRDPFVWLAPELPPADYIRVLAAATYRNSDPVVTTTHFSIGACGPDGKPVAP